MNVMHLANYKSVYKGNFIESLMRLRNELNSLGDTMCWLFPTQAQKSAWTNELQTLDNRVGYFDIDSYTNAVKQIGHAIDQWDVSIVHVHFITLPMLLMVKSVLLTRKNIKLVVHMHNHYPVDGKIKELIRRWTLSRAEFICCSKSVADDLKQNGYQDVHVVENAIGFDRLDAYVEKNVLQPEFSDDNWKLLMFGFDYYRKGVDIVLEAVKMLREKNNRIRLFISLSSNRESVENEICKIYGVIPEWVTLLSPRNDIASYYRNVDCFVSASREEGFCYALIEAAYCESILIGTKIPAQQDLILPECVWVNSDDVSDMVRGIKEAMTMKCDDRIAAQKESVIEYYDLTNWAKKIVKIYRRG